MAKRSKSLKLPKRRRARGTGTIFERADGWVGRVPVGRYPGGGTRYVEVTAPTQAGVVERMKAVQPPGPDTTVSQWCERWLTQIRVRPSTLAGYTAVLQRFVVPALGALRVANLNAGHIEATAARWKVAPNSARLNLRILSSCLNAARRAGLCAVNPVSDARKPKSVRKRITLFTPSELARIVAACSDPRERPVALMAATGLRIGEALGLNVEDYDRQSGTVTVRRTYDPTYGEREPKSATGLRTVGVPDGVRPVLDAAARDRTRGPLFAAPGGAGRFNFGVVRAAFGRVLDRLSLPRRNVHQLRHSVGTALATAVPLGDGAAYMGDTIQVFVANYVHATGADVRAALNAVLR